MYNIKRKMETAQTDIDTVETSEIASSAVETTKIADANVTVAKATGTRISGIICYPSGATGLQIDYTPGIHWYGGTAYNVSDSGVGGGAGVTVTAATGASIKLGIVQVTGSTMAIKYGTAVDETAGTPVYPTADAGNTIVAYIGTSGSPIGDSTANISGSMVVNNPDVRF